MEVQSNGSRLLNLPYDIRNRIWMLVVGDNIFHVKRTVDVTGARWSSWTCISTYSENIRAQITHTLDVESNFRHRDCRMYLHEDDNDDDGSAHSYGLCPDLSWSDDTDEEPLLSRVFAKHHHIRLLIRPQLEILRVCQQTYIECSPTLWSSNSFAFDSPCTLEAFIHHLEPRQLNLIKAVQFDIPWSARSMPTDCEVIFRMPVLQSLTGLEDLGILVNSVELFERSSFNRSKSHLMLKDCGQRSISRLGFSSLQNLMLLPEGIPGPSEWETDGRMLDIWLRKLLKKIETSSKRPERYMATQVEEIVRRIRTVISRTDIAKRFSRAYGIENHS